jgi:hypothetical protein
VSLAAHRNGVPASADGVDIYSWLPFTQQGLPAAATVTEKFVVDYNTYTYTYTYTESADEYVGWMNGLITAQLADTLRGLYSTPGVVKVRTGQKQVSSGTAVINSVRAFGPSSLTFIVTGTQHLTTSKGTSSGSTQYASRSPGRVPAGRSMTSSCPAWARGAVGMHGSRRPKAPRVRRPPGCPVRADPMRRAVGTRGLHRWR